MEAERLLNAIRQDALPHAILIAGMAGSGRAALARRAAAVYCLGEDAPEKLINSPHAQELSGEAVGVKEVRALMAATAMQGFNGQKRAFILTNAHRMSGQSQNALLKTLEEPPADTLIALSGNEAGLLPTIRSRCITVRLGAADVDGIRRELALSGVPPDRAALAASLSGGRKERAAAFADEEFFHFRAEALACFENALFGVTPFSEAAALITVSGGDDGQPGPADGRKKGKRADGSLTVSMLEIWESLARDALVMALGGSDVTNIDFEKLLSRMAARFTIGEIQGIIDTCETAQKRLFARAAPRMTLDNALARLYEKEITAR